MTWERDATGVAANGPVLRWGSGGAGLSASLVWTTRQTLHREIGDAVTWGLLSRSPTSGGMAVLMTRAQVTV